jgi:hypothetical protein
VKNRLFYYYHLAFVYAALCFSYVMLAAIPIMLLSYILGIFHPNGEHWPWWTILFICAYGTAGFLIRKAAVWELRRQRALAGQS